MTKDPSIKFKSRVYQYSAAFAANLGILSIGLHYGWTSAAVPVLRSGKYAFTLTPDEASWLVAIMPLSSLLGDVIAAVTINKIGRKKLILLSAIPLTISWILIAVADTKTNLFVSRVIAGVLDGVLFTVVPPYLAEISEAEIRGFIGGTFMMTLSLGLLMINVLLYFLSISTTAYISSVFSLIMLVIFPYLPDSPYYFLLHQQDVLARKSLRKLRGKWNVTEEIDRIRKGIEEDGEQGKIFDLITNKTYRKCLFISLLLTLTQHLSGIVPIQTYAETLFQDTKDFLDPSTTNIIYYLIFFLASIVSLVLADRAGRRPLVLFAAGTAALSQLANGIFLYLRTSSTKLDFLQLLFISSYTVAYCSGLHLMPVVVTTEIFPSNMKGVALCVINIVFSIASSFCIKLFAWSKDNFGSYMPFFLFSICTFVGFSLLYKYLPETKLKTMEKIQEELRGKKNKNERETFIDDNKL
ncbi:unnamed protein product [Phyllotreta striolata]|uniref:Major facilitator superfamily (MFS) profile domain-containing protein n=1 Tax=Phyllotreta striolata TaxID=444603 RepID=A0A9N9TSE0_PHYSR|nr:unnamed protein product [Phyllotreta striolata]